MDKTKKILLIMTIVFGLSTVALAVSTGVLKSSEKNNVNELEAHYQQAYFELLQQTNDMEVKLSKFLVSASNRTQQEILYDVWKGSEVSGTALAALSARDSGVAEAMKFENQLGDFAYYWAGKLADGNGLDEEAYQSFEKLHEVLKKLGEELGKVQTEIAGGYLFMKDFGGENDVLSGVLKDLNGGSVEYPKLIYDGPFSDSRENKEAKFLAGSKITSEEGLAAVKRYTAYHKVKSIDYVDLWQGDVPTHAYRLTTEDGEEMTVQITEQGGVLYALTMPAEVSDPTLSEGECVLLASQYLTAQGFEDMKAVWVSDSDSVVYVNFAATENGVVLYSDLIKVKVRADNGKIVGVEANNYILNHVKRNLDTSGIITAKKAAESVSARISLSTDEPRLALIPDGSGERLCYEFFGDYNGQYYVYIDARTGEEAEILFVIDSDGGKLLM